MALRDEILQQKEQKKKQEELAEVERKKQQEIVALQEQQKAEEEKNKKYSNYFALKEQVEAGNIPEEWLNIYERLIEKAKATLLEGREDFEVKEASTQKYYEQKLNGGVGEQCELNLMNKYLTERLIADGFKKASFKLEKVPEYYSTPADYKAQEAKQREYDRAAEEANDRARQQWMYDSFDGINRPTPAYIYPKLANLPKSGVKYRYEIIAKGSLYDKMEKKKAQGGNALFKVLSVLGVIAVAIGVVLGALYYINMQDVVGAIAYGVGGFLTSKALFRVGTSILQIINFSNNSDASLSVKKKNSAINALLIVLWVAVIVAIILTLNSFFPLQDLFVTE